MANLKGGNAIVRFLLAHGEKLGMAAVLVCAGMLFWSAVKHDHLGPDQQAEELVELATRASSHMEEFTWEGLDEEHKLQAEKVSGDAMSPIVSEHFPPIEDPWIRPVLEPMSKRTDPDLLVVEDLEVHGDSGLWASADPAVIEKMKLEALKERDRLQREEQASREREEADEERDGRDDDRGRGGRRGRGRNRRGGGGDIFGDDREDRRRDERTVRNDGPVVISSGSRNALEGFEQISAKSWVTVVAKVPIEKQYKLYDDALMNASGYDDGQDIPNYRGYIVERAEVTDEGRGDWQMVAKVGQRTLDDSIATYPFDPEELISDRYSHPLLTHPLPPLILRDWDRRVTHSTIPLAEEEAAELEEMEEPAEDEGDDQGGGEDFAAAPGDTGQNFEGEGRPRRPGQFRRERSRSMEMPGMEMEREFSGMAEGGRGGRSFSRGGDAGLFSWDGVTPYVLFRYFDDDVKPGHRYRYRVRLVLADVNNEVSEQFLDKTVSERRSKIQVANEKAIRMTDWSEPSPVASVPMPARVYLVSAEAVNPSTINSEPEAKLLVQSFNSELPAEIALEESFLRGSVLNIRSKASVLWVNRSDLDEEKESQEFDFRTGITVVDLRGGDKLGRDLTTPAQAVLMDPAGRLFLQSELSDQVPVKVFQDALEGGEDGGRPFDGGGRGEFFEGGGERGRDF